MDGEGRLHSGRVRGRRTPRVRAALLGATLLGLVACGREPGPAAEGPAPVASPAPLASERPAALTQAELLREGRALGLDRLELPADETEGQAPRLAARAIPEPAAPIARETPGRLLQSALELLRAGDPAALARLTLSPAERPVLNEDDAAEARRRFLGPSTRGYWERLLAAVAAGEATVVREDEHEAVVQVSVGGAAGVYMLRLRREGDGWFLAG